MGLCFDRPAVAAGEAVGAALERLVRRRYEELHRCYRPLLARNRSHEGAIYLELELGARGEVASVTVVRNELGDGVFAACIQSVVRRWPFAAAARAGAAGSTIQLPLSFRANPHQIAVALADVAPEQVAGSLRRGLLVQQNSECGGMSLEHWETSGTLALPIRPRLRIVWGLSGRGVIMVGAGISRSARPVRTGVAVAVGPNAAASIKGASAPVRVLAFDPGLKVRGLRRVGSVQAWAAKGVLSVGKQRLRVGHGQPRQGGAGSVGVSAGEAYYVLRGRGQLKWKLQSGEGWQVLEVGPELAFCLKHGVRYLWSQGTDLEFVRVVLPAQR